MFQFKGFWGLRSHTHFLMLCLLGCLAMAGPAGAAITGSGDLSPTDPTTWDADTDALIASSQYGDATFRMDGGSSLLINSAAIACGDMSSAKIALDGASTNLEITGTLDIGNGGWLELHVTNEAELTARGVTTLGVGDMANCRVYLDNGAIWNMHVAGAGLFTCGGGSGNVEVNITRDSHLFTYEALLGAGGEYATGIVDISGQGSTWYNSTTLTLGDSGGKGFLFVRDHAYLETMDLAINSESAFMMKVTNSDMVNIANNFTQNGDMYITADAKLATGAYTPINVSGSWTGSGTYHISGGIWNDATRVFTVTAAAQATTGVETTIDLSTTQRIELGENLCMNFAPTDASTQVNVTISQSGATLENQLAAGLDADESLHGGWQFDVSGLSDGSEVQLMFLLEDWASISDDYQRLADGLTVWHYDAAEGWTEFAADDLQVSEDGWASFTVDSFSGYAITSQPVPEPATLSLLGLAAAAMLRKRR